MSTNSYQIDYSYDDDSDQIRDNAEWVCAKCNELFTDPEDVPDVRRFSGPFERRLYWLSTTEPVCHNCATRSGIPPIDER